MVNIVKEVSLDQLLAIFRGCGEALEAYKGRALFHGCKVVVDSPRYKGPGVAVCDNTCWPDRVAVALPNGNTWHYEVECVKPEGSQ